MRFNFLAHRLIKEDGYGRMGLYLIRELAALGEDVTPFIDETALLPHWVQRMAGIDYSQLTLALMPGVNAVAVPGRQWIYSMYECSKIPEGWAEKINDYNERLIVPCQHNADVFRECGVRLPIHVIHGGTPPEEFPVLAAPKKERPYTFLALGDRGSRKGFDIVWRAFYNMFQHSKDVRLIIKCRGGALEHIDFTGSEHRVSVWREDIDSMADVFAQVDCFVFPTRCEGWGMPPREAACMGLPVIATDYSGTAVDIEHWAIPIRNYTLIPSTLQKDSVWAQADVDEVGQHMRWCFDNRDEARCRALKAAQWIRDNATWRHSAIALRDMIERHS